MNGTTFGEARLHYLPARRCLLANGWTQHIYSGSCGTSTKFEHRDAIGQIEVFEAATGSGASYFVMSFTAPGHPAESTVVITSMQHAVDYLVVAGVLPANVASWTVAA